jgi:hypothetical protein
VAHRWRFVSAVICDNRFVCATCTEMDRHVSKSSVLVSHSIFESVHGERRNEGRRTIHTLFGRDPHHTHLDSPKPY